MTKHTMKSFFMYIVQDEDTIKKEILLHLSSTKRGFVANGRVNRNTKRDVVQTQVGVPMGAASAKEPFSEIVVLVFQSANHHFCKCCQGGV